MFWANTTPLPDATTDLGVIPPRITVNGTIRSCEVGTRGLVDAGRVVAGGLVVADVGAPVVVVGRALGRSARVDATVVEGRSPARDAVLLSVVLLAHAPSALVSVSSHATTKKIQDRQCRTSAIIASRACAAGPSTIGRRLRHPPTPEDRRRAQ